MAPQKLPVHAQVEDFTVTDNCLVVGNRKITDLAKQIGSTPFYVYDSSLIRKRLEALRRAMPDELQIHYAIKANPLPDVVNFIGPQVDGLDVASAKEMHVALDAGVPAKEISFAGPGKRPEELREAIGAGIVITLESRTEMHRVVEIGKELGIVPLVAVRVNPDFELRTSGMKMSGGPKQFGIDAEIVPDILQELSGYDVQFVGFHIFCGSQNLQEEAIIEAQEKTVTLALKLAMSAPAEPRFINIGGGFGIPYFPGDKPLPLDRIGEHLELQLKRVRSALPSTSVVIELGRYIVGEAGVYVCRVLDRKISRGSTFLVTDGGLHHHLAASGNFGQIIRKNYPLIVGNRVFSDTIEAQTVVGPLCTPLDLLGDRMELPPADVDDLIVVLQSGAYGYTASPLSFLSHPFPRELLL